MLNTIGCSQQRREQVENLIALTDFNLYMEKKTEFDEKFAKLFAPVESDKTATDSVRLGELGVTAELMKGAQDDTRV